MSKPKLKKFLKRFEFGSPPPHSLKMSKLKLTKFDRFGRLKFIIIFFYLSSFCWEVWIIMNIYCDYFPLHPCQTTGIYVSLNLPGNIKWFVHYFIITLLLWFFLQQKQPVCIVYFLMVCKKNSAYGRHQLS